MIYELSLYMGRNGKFANAVSQRRQRSISIVEKTFEMKLSDEKMLSKGWWNAYGMEAPHIKGIEMTLLSLSPSTYLIQRSSSILDRIHTKSRNQFGNGRVEDILFIVI